ncbi:hypothetical protein KIW84_070919 [Lathyrus oleraceus]|uniref:Succinate dehydrogenase assembly factor 4, mitochondrial n=1 Tax=Pisum sativum TaxID=3888 RepID=A0A9D4VHP8_PEA|nr:hypothetical protein KIW84_070919 [Pisum sativum]
MTTSFPRLLSTASNPTLLRTGSEHLTRSVSNSVTRLLSSSTQHHHNNTVRDQPQTPAPESLKQSEKEEEEEDDGDEIDLNKETGEVGGPKGPEPTSFNGSCGFGCFVRFSSCCILVLYCTVTPSFWPAAIWLALCHFHVVPFVQWLLLLLLVEFRRRRCRFRLASRYSNNFGLAWQVLVSCCNLLDCDGK